MLVLDPLLYEFAAQHQCALRDAADRARPAGAREPGWRWLLLGVFVAMVSRTLRSVASPRVVCRRLLPCKHASAEALVGHDV